MRNSFNINDGAVLKSIISKNHSLFPDILIEKPVKSLQET